MASTRTPDGSAALLRLRAAARVETSAAFDPGRPDRVPPPRPDHRIARCVAEALGDAGSVLDLGPTGGSPIADRLPFADGEFEGAMALLGLHQWPSLDAGLREVRRVTRGPVVVLTHDPARIREFWLHRYAPEVLDIEARRHPTIDRIAAGLGGDCTVRPVPVPLDCTDGFDEAYYGRPELLLDPAARQAGSAWSFIDDRVRERFDRSLRRDLASGAWDARHGRLRTTPFHEGSLVIVRAVP
ncbi:SAM-dependent methyltransferase [Streptomyces sp. NPDC097619]|uniref:class I SAM-dependent methyltransferase n=1 Tax=Streptomyces sp. NPDC097619 TaxID=3157228 RepID=UPI0033294E7E